MRHEWKGRVTQERRQQDDTQISTSMSTGIDAGTHAVTYTARIQGSLEIGDTADMRVSEPVPAVP